MLIELLPRVRVHAAEFGYVVERRSGRPMRELGRHATRITQDFPPGCLPLAFPNRLASHVAGLPAAIDPAHSEGALILSPAYRRDGRGRLLPAWVTAQRVKMFPEDDKPGLPGDATRSAALVWDWPDYCAHAPRIGSVLSALTPRPVPADEPERQDRARPTLALEAATGEGEPDATVLAILGAVRRGQRLRLDERWQAQESGFLAALLAALAALPEPLRGHVSASAGLTDPDHGIQIAWARDGRGMDPTGAAACALLKEGDAALAGSTQGGREPPAIEDDPAFVGVAHLLASSFEEPGLHALPRRAIRRWFDPSPRAAIDGHEAARFARAALAEGDLSPANADLLLAWAVENGRGTPPATGELGATLALLRGCAPIDAPLQALAAAVEICDRSDVYYTSARALQIRRMAGELFSAQLTAKACPSDAFLDAILSREGLTSLAARQVSRGDRAVIEALRRGLVMRTRREGAHSPKVGRLIGALLPRDSRIVADWRGYAEDDGCLARGLFAAAEAHRAPIEAAGRLADGLLDGGKWNVVREALGRIVTRLGRIDAAEPPDPEENARRLEMLMALAGAMLRACEPDARERRAS